MRVTKCLFSKQNLVEEQFTQRSMLITEAREEFAICQNADSGLREECSQFLNELQTRAIAARSESGAFEALKQECKTMQDEYHSAMANVKKRNSNGRKQIAMDQGGKPFGRSICG